MDLAISPWETMEFRRSLMRGQCLAPGGKAGRQDRLLTGLSGAGDPVDTGIGALPDPGLQPSPDVAIR